MKVCQLCLSALDANRSQSLYGVGLEVANMKRSLFAGLNLLAIVVVAPAAAADLPTGMPQISPAYIAPSFYNWTGFYIGAHGGYAWGTGNLDLDGGFVGGQIGFNWQPVGTPWMFGLELDSAWADIGKSVTVATAVGALNVSTNANYMGSFRGRIGYAFERTMIYATGGLGWIRNEITVSSTLRGFFVGASDSKYLTGGLIGAGIEHAFAPSWTIKGEYIYGFYNSAKYFEPVAGGFSTDPDVQTVKLGVNYLFR
jgi:outer membrane immunogenic protein